MTRQEQVQNLAKIARISVSYAEDLYDSFFPKPIVPQYVADWYEEHKKGFDYELWDYLSSWEYQEEDDFKKWIGESYETDKPIITLVNMHQFGYEVEKEARYTVRIKVTNQYLCNDEGHLHFSPGFRTDFTKSEIESFGLGWVFNCEGIKIEEAE